MLGDMAAVGLCVGLAKRGVRPAQEQIAGRKTEPTDVADLGAEDRRHRRPHPVEGLDGLIAPSSLN